MCLASFLAKFSFLGGHRGTQPMKGWLSTAIFMGDFQPTPALEKWHIIWDVHKNEESQENFDQVLKFVGVVWMGLHSWEWHEVLLSNSRDPATDNIPNHKAQRRIVWLQHWPPDGSPGPTSKQLTLSTLWQQAELEGTKEVVQAGRADSIPDQTVEDTGHCLEFLSEGFLHFRKKTPKQQKYFEKALLPSCICLKKRTYSKQPVLVASAHTKTDSRSRKQGKKKQFLNQFHLKITSMQNLGTSVTAVVFKGRRSPHMNCLVSLKEP